MDPVNNSRTLFKGALALTVAALIVKVLSALYRVPFQNMVGDTGFYIYQQVYPIYAIALVLSTSGFPVIISKLYIERKNKENLVELHRLLLVSTIVLSLIGIFCFITLYCSSEWLAEKMRDPHLALLIRVVSLTFLVFPINSLLRGYFQGEGNMIPTAYSQVGEQLIRVMVILMAAMALVKRYDLYVVGAGASLGAVSGGMASILILLTFIWIERRKRILPPFHFRRIFDMHDAKSIVKSLIFQGFAICVSSMLLIFLQLADSLNLYSILVTAGINGDDAKELKGVYDRGHPLVQLGSIIATSMSLSLVPLIASEKQKRVTAVLHNHIQLALRVSLAIGLGAACGLIMIIEPTNMMLFKNTDGSGVLSVLSIMILFSSVIITVVAILQGLGHMMFPAFVVLFGFGLKFVLNMLLVPLFGTMGAAISSNAALIFILGILILKLYSIIKKPLISVKFLAVIMMAALAMIGVLKGYLFITEFFYMFGKARLIASVQALSSVLVGGLTYLYILFKFRGFTPEEISLFPFGSKLMYLFPNKDRS